MKIAILGGGFTGLTSAYHLAKKGHGVTLFEKEKVLGGLAAGFKQANWNWYLERAYHHLFSNDEDILNFAKEAGFEKIIFRSPETASLYENTKHEARSTKQYQNTNAQNPRHLEHFNFGNSDLFRISNFEFRIYPLDSPQDLLRFPLLSLPQKIRTGIILAFLKCSPFLSTFERETAQEFLKKSMGENVWNVLWQELFRKKFGKYAGNILASFIWARIKKRTKQLGYIEGGFQTFINYLEKELINKIVKIRKGTAVESVEKNGEEFELSVGGLREQFDCAISTLPTAVMGNITQNIFSQDYLARFKKLKYLHAINLVLETKEPILEKAYWLNICTDKIPFMVLVQHTNFMDKKNYSGNHIAYLGWYVDRNDILLKMKGEELLELVKPHLEKIRNSKFEIRNYYHFIGPFAQPIFDRDFVKNKPDFITPIKNFFIANLDMTYPYDRGTNYAVKLGKQVSEMI